MSVFESGTTVNAIVADIGSSASKVGFAGEDYPRAYFRSSVATLRDETKEDGSKARRRRRPIQRVNYDSLSRPLEGDTDGNWQVSNPVDPTTGLWYDPEPDGAATWADLIPTFLQHGYESSLGLKTMQDNPLLLIERSYNPPPIRQQVLEILMEECQVPATFFGRDATMACYATARTTSTVIDIGHSGTTVTPVFDGYVEQKAIRRSPIGSLKMDELALQQLQACLRNTTLQPLYKVRRPNVPTRPEAFHRYGLLEIARDCRESGALQSINTAASKTLHVPSMSYSLPDGETVDIPSQYRFAVADLVVGGSSAPPVEGGAATTTNPREHALKELQTRFDSIVQTALQEAKDEDDDDENNEDDDDDDDDQASREQQAAKYTDATAVGVSSRRTTRGGRSPSKPRKKAKTNAAAASTKVVFDNRILQKACGSYLQSFSEQLTAATVAEMVCDAVFRCDRDQQASVLGNAVLCGGGACIGPTDQAVPDLLRDQMEAIIHTHTPGWRVKVLSPSIPERAICSWLGGSILGSLGTFHDMWISKAEYEEWGSAIINRKCP